MSNRQVFLIDTHAMCYRAFFAVRALSNSKGQPTNAVFGFCQILRKLLNDFKPDYVAACFDMSAKTLRQEKYAEYKIQRQAMPEDLRSQMPIIRSIIEAYQIPIFEQEGHEADDVIASIAECLKKEAVDVVIVSDDKDLSQLMDRNVLLYAPRLEKFLTDEDIKEKFGVYPNRMVDYLALVGDSSDNIPGVPGIGPVSAVKLLNAYDSFDGVYQHLDEIKPPGVQEKLKKGQASGTMSRELATVDRALSLDCGLERLKRKAENKSALFQLYSDLEFRKFAQEYASGSLLELVESTEPKVKIDFLDDSHTNERVVYDLKSFYKERPQDITPSMFDLFLAEYLLNKVVLRGGEEPFSSKENFKQAYVVFSQEIKDQQLDYLLREVEMPLSIVLAQMEDRGVKIDLDVLKTLSILGDETIKKLQESLFQIAGQEFNVNSPKQLGEVLFEKLKLPVVKKTKTGYSTDEEVLQKLSSKHPLPALILEYRQMAKLKSTYIDALPTLVDQENRLHTSYNQTGAETGRLSSTNPNLQNIPIRTELGRKIRKAFIPFNQDNILLSADYSQIELRLLAHFSKDENLIKAFQEDADIHRFTASLMFDISQDTVDEQMRYSAKRINFGIVYGMSAFGLSKDLNISVHEAQDFIDKYFLRYPKVLDYMECYKTLAQKHGYVETLFHRRRYLPDINSANGNLRQFAQRQAINAPLQGTAADIIKIAMVNINGAMQKAKLKSSMIMTVHDELVFNMLKDEKDQLTELVCSLMENVMKLDVPLRASLKLGPNWLEMKPL